MQREELGLYIASLVATSLFVQVTACNGVLDVDHSVIKNRLVFILNDLFEIIMVFLIYWGIRERARTIRPMAAFVYVLLRGVTMWMLATCDDSFDALQQQCGQTQFGRGLNIAHLAVLCVSILFTGAVSIVFMFGALERAVLHYFLGQEQQQKLTLVVFTDPKYTDSIEPVQQPDTTIPPPPTERSPCSICLVDFVPGESTRTTDCTHKFHSGCLIPWQQVKNACPVCRAKLYGTAIESPDPLDDFY